MTEATPQIKALCEEFGIRIADPRRYPDIGETRAVATMERIRRRFGDDHLRMVLVTLNETANNKALLDEVGLWMTSDMIRACQSVIDRNASEWLAVWDAMPVGQLQFLTRELSGIVPQRHALSGMVFERLARAFGPPSRQPDLLDDRRTS